ncbi:hypothetical protein Tco_1080377 [Tanacetum coccineum]|uniref:Uncharacterized protein n=1 Tax=Tanacetum coccineum TaxID=301880 RepID=A0ABQ5HUI7_9ASTR
MNESRSIPEAEKKFKQLESDEEMERKIQEEWEAEEERNSIAEEKAANEALIRNLDEIKVQDRADRLLAERTSRTRKRAIYNRRKRARNFKHAELKIKKFEEVHALYEKIKRVNRFHLIGSAKDERKYPIKEKTECLRAKPQTDQAEHLEEINLNVVIRSNRQKRYFSTLTTLLSIFDREDLNAVYQLVMDKYQDEMPEFMTKYFGRFDGMFNPDDEKEIFGMHSKI